jgi:hypothetical protein
MRYRGPRIGDPISSIAEGDVGTVVSFSLYQPHVPVYLVDGSDGKSRAVKWMGERWLDTVAAVTKKDLPEGTGPAIHDPDAARGAVRGGKGNRTDNSTLRGSEHGQRADRAGRCRLGLTPAVPAARARSGLTMGAGDLHARLDAARAKRWESDAASERYHALVAEVDRVDPGFYEGR